jgi:hypothetical protein
MQKYGYAELEIPGLQCRGQSLFDGRQGSVELRVCALLCCLYQLCLDLNHFLRERMDGIPPWFAPLFFSVREVGCGFTYCKECTREDRIRATHSCHIVHQLNMDDEALASMVAASAQQ